MVRNGTEHRDLNVEPPRFDEIAAAKAQPVEPLRGGLAAWLRRSSGVREMITGRGRVLALIIIAGLATGTFGGMLMVNKGDGSQQSSLLSLAESRNTAPNEFNDAEVGVRAMQTENSFSTRVRRPRAARRTNNGVRAYRFAVIH